MARLANLELNFCSFVILRDPEPVEGDRRIPSQRFFQKEARPLSYKTYLISSITENHSLSKQEKYSERTAGKPVNGASRLIQNGTS